MYAPAANYIKPHRSCFSALMRLTAILQSWPEFAPAFRSILQWTRGRDIRAQSRGLPRRARRSQQTLLHGIQIAMNFLHFPSFPRGSGQEMSQTFGDNRLTNEHPVCPSHKNQKREARVQDGTTYYRRVATNVSARNSHPLDASCPAIKFTRPRL